MSSHSRRFQTRTVPQNMLCESLERRLLNSSTSLALRFSGAAGVVSEKSPVAGSLTSPSVSNPTRVGEPYEVTSKSVKISIISNDSSLSFRWETTETSSGKVVSFAKNNSNSAKENTLKFSEAGLYVVTVSVVQARQVVATSTLTFRVTSVLASLSVTDAAGTPANSSTPIVTAGKSVQLNAVALDQFGIRLSSQPVIQWNLKSQPKGATANTSQSGNNLEVGVPAAGEYVFRATFGSLASDVPVKVTPVLSSLTVVDDTGSAVSPDSSINVKSTSTKLTLAGRDQFDNPMSTLPSLTWSTLSAPDGGVISTSVKGATAVLNVNRPGAYTFQAKYGNVIVGGALQVTPTLAAFQFLNSESRPFPSGKSVAVAGTSLSLRYVPLDQFGKPLVQSPVVQWSVPTAPTGSSAKFNTNDGIVTATFDRAGSYTFRLQSDSVRAELPVTVSASLTDLSLGVPEETSDPGSPVAVTAATQRLLVNARDQFGMAMSVLPKLQWTTPTAPTGGNASVRLTGTTAQVAFSTSGTWTVAVSFGSITASRTLDVIPTATRVALRDSSGKAIPGTSPLPVTGKSLALSAIVLDQFGVPLASQPDVTWRLSRTPTGATGTINTSGNSASVEFDRTGDWTVTAQGGTVSAEVKISVVAALSSLTFTNMDGSAISADQPIAVTTALQTLKLNAVDQFGKAISVLPKLTWTTTNNPDGGVATGKNSSGVATISFNKAGQYTVKAASGTVSATASLNVVQTLRTIAFTSADGRTVNPNATVTVTSASSQLNAVPVDQFGVTLANPGEVTWERISAPSGAATEIKYTGTSLRVQFDRFGSYVIRGSIGDVTVSLKYEVVQTLASVVVTPNVARLSYGASQVFKASALDQFGTALSVQPTFRWSAAGGTISSIGTFKAGTVAGTFTVTATGGQKRGEASIEVSAPVLPSGLQDPAISAAVSAAYSDGLLNRTEVISILRVAGEDGAVSGTELADFQYLVSPGGGFVIPDYVRNLASDVVNSNPANAKFQGQTLGNLSAGSSSSQLNRLIDKSFFGADVPQLTTTGLSWVTSTGTLFPSTPSRADAKQGLLGDCYFISALAAIADRNPNAVRNMFIDNGDGTYTVRFYTGQYGDFNNSGTITSGFASGAGTADYVTVNRSLPVNGNGSLVYSGYGLSATSTSTILWIALAEKAYAQWNETGGEGRDGTNRYAAIEGGWMANVNCQVLGYNSTNFPFFSTSKQTLINALTAQRAVTLGTQSSPANGLVGSHAYVVTGYDSTSDTFRLHNPWGTSHPGALTWAQLQANCSWFVTVDTSGSQSFSSPGGVSGSSSPRTTAITPREAQANAPRRQAHNAGSEVTEERLVEEARSTQPQGGAEKSVAGSAERTEHLENASLAETGDPIFPGNIHDDQQFLVLTQNELDLLISELADELLLPLS